MVLFYKVLSTCDQIYLPSGPDLEFRQETDSIYDQVNQSESVETPLADISVLGSYVSLTPLHHSYLILTSHVQDEALHDTVEM